MPRGAAGSGSLELLASCRSSENRGTGIIPTGRSRARLRGTGRGWHRSCVFFHDAGLPAPGGPDKEDRDYLNPLGPFRDFLRLLKYV